MKTLLSAGFTALALSLPASAFTAQNGMVVQGGDATDFYVMYKSVPRETDYLCAAGDFLISGLGLPSNTRFYRSSPPPRKQGQGIRFTTDANRMVKMDLFTSYGKDPGDGGISAGAATGAYCQKILLFPFN